MPQSIKLDTKEWRGNRASALGAYRRYEFPVTVYKLGPSGERIPVEASDR
ncbi:hypothetical protein [Streptomyces sp. CBMA29]|nr:hypothetical protein [Streptomyces sp. CBMA29]